MEFKISLDLLFVEWWSVAMKKLQRAHDGMVAGAYVSILLDRPSTYEDFVMAYESSKGISVGILTNINDGRLASVSNLTFSA